jgi:aldehyde:ferredoxin oxidoreductase
MDYVIGRSAIIDLSNKISAVETISDDDIRKFLGGNGLAIKTLLDKMKPGVDAFSPENILFFGTGPITGTGIQGSDRTYIAAKSPLTGLFFDSTMGGRFASSLKQAGYDTITIVGKANEPSYVLVGSGGVEIHDARDLVGKSPEEVRGILSTRLKNFEVCSIGIAGENLVKYASIIHPRANGRPGVAGRGGLGAVMGSKNLKAIAVHHGKESKASVHSNALLRDVKDRIQNNLNVGTASLTLGGTAFGVKRINSLGGLGTRNLKDEMFESAGEISGERLKDKYYKKNITCHSCPVACGKLCELDGKLVKNPEYETIYALGSMVGIGDLEAIIRANILCDRYGLDTISMGVTLAFAIECFDKGVLSLQQSGGRNLKFGDARLMLDLIEETAYRRGIGDLLAEGTKYMSKRLEGDSWKYAYQVKGLELAGHSARVNKVLSIGYATNTRGGSHQDARVRYGPNMDTYEGKVELAIATQHLSAVGDSLVQCRFVMERGLGDVITDEFSNLLKAVTGWGPSPNELNEIGERIFNLERIFNIREGISRKDDTLPYKVMWEEIPQGPHKGQRTSPEKLEELLDMYYKIRGWDTNGIPREKTLECLGLKEYFTGSDTLESSAVEEEYL